METTVDRIRISDEWVAFWDFILASDSTSCAEAVEEMTEICRHLFNSFGGFITAKEMRYYVVDYSGMENSPYDGPGEYKQKISGKISSEEGITFPDIINNLSNNILKYQELSGMEFVDLDVKVYVNEEERIDEYLVSHTNDVPTDTTLLRITIYYLPNREHTNVESEGIYELDITTYTDTWFGDTETDQKNRQQLDSCFQKIFDSLPVKTVEYERYSGPRTTLHID